MPLAHRKKIRSSKSQHSHTFLERQFKWLAVSCILLVICILTARATFNMYEKAQNTGVTAASVSKAVSEMEQRHNLAKLHAESVGTERGIDREIRARYGVKKPGEGVIILVDDPSNNKNKKSLKGEQ